MKSFSPGSDIFRWNSKIQSRVQSTTEEDEMYSTRCHVKSNLVKKVGLLGAKKIPRQFLYPVGSKLDAKFGLRQEDYQLPRLSIITCVGIGIHNLLHPGFSIKFLRN